jgi:cytochrome c oxidase subunit 4
MNPHSPSPKTAAQTWFALVVMHFLILGSAYLNLNGFNTPLLMTLALVQMVLVILYFMEARCASPLVWLFVTAGFFWFGILVTLTLSDYLTRAWH